MGFTAASVTVGKTLTFVRASAYVTHFAGSTLSRWLPYSESSGSAYVGAGAATVGAALTFLLASFSAASLLSLSDIFARLRE